MSPIIVNLRDIAGNAEEEEEEAAKAEEEEDVEEQQVAEEKTMSQINGVNQGLRPLHAVFDHTGRNRAVDYMTIFNY